MYSISRNAADQQHEQIQRLGDRFLRRGQRDGRDAGQQPVDQQIDEIHADDRGGRDRDLPHFGERHVGRDFDRSLVGASLWLVT